MSHVVAVLALMIGHFFIVLAGAALTLLGGVMSMRAERPRDPVIWTIWFAGFLIAAVGLYSIALDLKGLIP